MRGGCADLSGHERERVERDTPPAPADRVCLAKRAIKPIRLCGFTLSLVVSQPATVNGLLGAALDACAAR